MCGKGIFMKINFAFGHFKKVRESKNLSRKSLVRMKKVKSPHTVTRLEESGNVTVKNFLRICEGLEIHPSSFFEVEL